MGPGEPGLQKTARQKQYNRLIGSGNHDSFMKKNNGGSMTTKGPWIHRFSIRLFTLFLAVLVYWVLGFLVQDIESIPGPSYDAIEQRSR